MNNLESLVRDYAHDYRDMSMDEIELAILLTRFGNQIIEKLIEDFKAELQVTEEHSFIKQLRSKWLGKNISLDTHFNHPLSELTKILSIRKKEPENE